MIWQRLPWGSQYVKWTAFFKEACGNGAEFNRGANPPIPITYPMLTSMGKDFSTGVQQAQLQLCIGTKLDKQAWRLGPL